MKKTAIAIGIVAALALATTGLAFAEDGNPGMDLYNKKCAMCHGKDGVAKKMAEGSANFNDAEWQKAASKDDVVKMINEGKGKMKGFADKLSAEEIGQIADYVMSMK